MVQLKPSGPALEQPKPKYGHLSEIDPEWASLREEIDKNFVALWQLPMDEFKAAWLSAPVALPENAPEQGKDYEIEELQVPVRDGTKVGVRLYKPIKPVSNGVLVLKAHGGGWVVGGHEVEEVENRMLAAHAKAVVASVDYRMAPEYKFPYAINDCFDVMKWVSPDFRQAYKRHAANRASVQIQRVQVEHQSGDHRVRRGKRWWQHRMCARPPDTARRLLYFVCPVLPYPYPISCPYS